MTPAVVVGTSLFPRRLDAQRAAVASWRALGFGVVSVNAAAETDAVRTAFPDVDVVTTVDGAADPGVPHRRLTSLVQVAAIARASGARTVGIANADVELAMPADLRAALPGRCEGALVAGCRIDVAEIGGRVGRVERLGFDYFFMDADVATRLPEDGFGLGEPWSDYWLPFAAVAAGYAVRRFATPVGFHAAHPCEWSRAAWEAGGRKFARCVADAPDIEHVRAMRRLVPFPPAR